jgi:glycerol-3-phosphate O-acyltransferase/dihydroxyacetone phosphate acyltransferase
VLIGVWWPREMPLPSFLASSTVFAPDPPKIAGLPKDAQPEKYKKPKRLPSRVLVRHVLRMRLEAARDLAGTLFELEEKDVQVNASFWLAERYGGEVLKVSKEHEEMSEWERPLPSGRRSGREVVEFLRSKGARLGTGWYEGHWAVSSGDEGSKTEDEK